MPGNVLIFDPQITNRIMLKAQLSRDFFNVYTAADTEEFEQRLRLGSYDIIMLSYNAERAQGFETLHKLRSNSDKPYVPVVFLHSGDDPHIWDHSHDCLVDDVMSYSAERWLVATRINLLIRAKEKIHALTTRHQTIAEMGFAEEGICFPPLQTHAVTLDFSKSTAACPSGFLYDLTTLMAQDFPSVEIRSTFPETTSPQSDVHIIDETALGRDTALAALCAVRKSDADASILYCCPPDTPQSAIKALELGATDFTTNVPDVPELTCRLRRLVWLRHATRNAEKSVSEHLRSALTDPLTGLYNRRYAQQHLAQLLVTAKNCDHSVTAMVVDLDRFKSINDTYGHLTGDAVLRQAAQRLSKGVRGADLVARLGGEEFLVVLKATPLDTVRDIAERLRQEISSTPFKTEKGQDVYVSASIGVSATHSDWTSANAIIDCADLALYRAKGDGRNRVTFGGKAA